MTVASAKSRIPKRVVEFIWPETQSSRYSVVKRNFESIDSPKQKENLIDQLDLMVSDVRKAKAFLLSEKGAENRKAFTLLKEMIHSNDAEIATKARKIFVLYLQSSITKQNLMGPSIDPKNQTKAESAFETLCTFINEGNQEDRINQAITIANSCGYLYQEAGDDRSNTFWKRGRINPEGKAGRDTRLFNFFHDMQQTESGRLMHKLALEAGLQDIHGELYAKHISGSETGLSDQVRASLDQQTKATSPALNPSRIWGDKSFIDTISPANPDEEQFLNKFKKSVDFRFSIAELERGYLKSNTRDRKALVLDFVAAFELLSYRKACLIKAASASDDPVLNRAAKLIEAKQKRMLEALKEHSGREPQLAQAIQEMFKAQGTSVFMYHMVGALGAAEKSVSTLVSKEAADMLKQYGVNSIRLASGKTLSDSYQDLTTLRKETEQRVETDSIALANSALRTVGRDTLLDDKAISAFERHSGSNVVLSTSVITAPTPPSTPTTADENRWAEIQKLYGKANPAPTYFGLNAACADFKSQINASTDPSIKYAVKNFERIYGLTIDEVLQRVKNRERITTTDTEENFLINTQERFLEQVQKVLEEARAKNSHRPKNFDFCHAVTTGKYSIGMTNIISGEHTLAPERLIAQIVNVDNKAHQDVGFGMESLGHLERLLLSPDMDTDAQANVQKSERILGILELERRILSSAASSDEKKAAVEYIHNNLLGETGFILTQGYESQLNSALGTGVRDYKGILAASSPTQLTALLKSRYALDDLSIATGNISRTVMGFMKTESELLISGFEGNLPEGMFSSDETSMLDNILGIQDKIQKALDADTLEAEAGAVADMVEDFCKAGFPVDQLFPAGSIDDGLWKDKFIFADQLFHSPDGEGSDIIQILVQIWQNILRSLAQK